MLYTVFDVETSGLERGCDVLSFAYALTDESVGVKRAEVLYFWKEELPNGQKKLMKSIIYQRSSYDSTKLIMKRTCRRCTSY